MLLPILAVLLGCYSTSPLSGTVSMSPQSEWSPVVYLIDPQDWNSAASSFLGHVIDSAKIDANGYFKFEKLPLGTEPQLFELAIQKKAGSYYPNRLDNDDPNVSNYFPFVYKKGENIVIKTEDAHFQRRFSIEKPSVENEALLKLRDIRQAAFDKFLASKEPNSHDATTLIDEEKAKHAYKQALMAFAQETPYLLPSLMAIRWISVEGNYEPIPEFMVAQAERWKAIAPDNAWVKELNKKADRRLLPVLVGDEIPNYDLPMLSNKTQSLHTLLGKRLTILDLWASWCAPCRKENRHYLVPLWDKYHNKGLQIVGYALDSDKNAWSNAIKKDGADRWLHASDLQGDNAALFKQLRLTSIPANFILDEKGRVVAKNLHADELVQFIDKFFMKE